MGISWSVHLRVRTQDERRVLKIGRTPGSSVALQGKCAEFTGWMFWDAWHDDEAENTAPGRPGNWRATAWEIHPITAIRVVPYTN